MTAFLLLIAAVLLVAPVVSELTSPLITAPSAPPAPVPKVVATVPAGSYNAGVAYDSAKGEVFVASTGFFPDYYGTVWVISDTTNTIVANISLGKGLQLHAIAYDSSKGEVFVTDLNSNTVYVISDTTNAVIATVKVGGSLVGLAYDSSKGEVFATNENTVSVISDITNEVVANVSVADKPTAVAYDSSKGEVFVANVGIWAGPVGSIGNFIKASNISVISDATYAVVATISMQGGSGDLAYDPAKGEVFVANDQIVSVISDATNTVFTTVYAGNQPLSFAYDSGKGEVFVGNAFGMVYVISDGSRDGQGTSELLIFLGVALAVAVVITVFYARSRRIARQMRPPGGQATDFPTSAQEFPNVRIRARGVFDADTQHLKLAGNAILQDCLLRSAPKVFGH
jgi:YVTN family beta-propeller protein